MGSPLKNNKGVVYVTAGSVFCLSFVLHFLSFIQSDYANGWDGYYYVMQAHSWITYGHLQSSDYSLIYPFFITISLIVKDYILAFKLGSAILAALLSVSGFIYVQGCYRKQGHALLTALIITASPTTFYFTSQFPKNVLGLVFLIFSIYFIHKRKLLPGLAFIILSLLTHRMTGGLGLLLALFVVFKQLSIRWKIGALAFIFLASFLPGILHFSDFERFNGEFQAIPQFAPLSFIYLFNSNLTFFWKIELIFLCLSTTVAIWLYIKKSDLRRENEVEKLAWPFLYLICLFPFFVVSQASLGLRFFLIFPCLNALYLGSRIMLPGKVVYAVCILLAGLSMFTYKTYNPAKHDPPNQLYEHMIGRIEETYDPSNYPLIISHKSLAEMIIYKTAFDALNWIPPDDVDRKKILRVVHNLDYYHFSKHLDAARLDSVVKITNRYFILPESLWEDFLNNVRQNDDDRLEARILSGNNPMAKRPYFLTKGKSDE